MNAPTRTRGPLLSTAIGLVVIVAATVGLVLYERSPAAPQPPTAASTTSSDGVIDAADGVLPEGVGVTETAYPGVANLETALLHALQDAAEAAGARGVTLTVTSGWRSPEYQQQLLADAVVTYGSEEEAARWVATPATSPHVTGNAVDIGPYDAIDWLSRFGAEYGLCQIYVNEPWHFELRPEAVGSSCPRPYLDPTEDPRLQ